MCHHSINVYIFCFNHKGVTGNMSIDSNGDRSADYNLLDLDPDMKEFRVSKEYLIQSRTIVFKQN